MNLHSGTDFSDGNGNPAGTEIITFFNQAGDFRTTEKSLYLPLFRGISLLYLGSHGVKRGTGMHHTGAGCPLDAIPASSTAD